MQEVYNGSMLDSLLAFDSQLFQLIYHLPHPFLLVLIMEFFSLIGYFGIIWLAISYFQKKMRPVFIALLLVFLIVDLLLKFVIARPRPYSSTFDSFLPWESFSFPSGHAAAAFAYIYILLKFKSQKSNVKPNSKLKIRISILSLAVIISFSRIYLGKHYPFDVVGGAIVGLGIGWIVNKFKR